MNERITRPCVLVFAGHDPSGGAGIQADIEAIAAQGAHALPIITALTVQDNNQVRAVYPVDTHILLEQFETLLAQVPIAAVKVGIVGSRENAELIAECVARLRNISPSIAVIVDPVLASGRGDALAIHDAVLAVQAVLHCASLITPNLPELLRLTGNEQSENKQSASEQLWSAQSDEARMRDLCQQFSCDIFLKGGHAHGDEVCNRWLQWPADENSTSSMKSWNWPRLAGEFHGSGCTLAAAIVGQFACGHRAEVSLMNAQNYTQCSLKNAYQIAAGQSIPWRSMYSIEKDFL